ncbi:MAG: 30S ribosomal protein S15, partial [Dehalococcoidales bacterium]|nr:30S ribosomal protein S15 [Dehalococcoidales bacterium]
MDKALKQQVIEQYGRSKGDTGSPEVQVAILTERISQLTAHAASNKHDYDTHRGLLRLVIQRRRLLSYLSKKDADRYNKLIQSLG